MRWDKVLLDRTMGARMSAHVDEKYVRGGVIDRGVRDTLGRKLRLMLEPLVIQSEDVEVKVGDAFQPWAERRVTARWHPQVTEVEIVLPGGRGGDVLNYQYAPLGELRLAYETPSVAFRDWTPAMETVVLRCNGWDDVERRWLYS